MTSFAVKLTALSCLLSSGCAGQKYQVEWYAVTNKDQTCAARKTAASNDSGCVEKTGDRCVFWTRDKRVSYDDLGSLARACFK